MGVQGSNPNSNKSPGTQIFTIVLPPWIHHPSTLAQKIISKSKISLESYYFLLSGNILRWKYLPIFPHLWEICNSKSRSSPPPPPPRLCIRMKEPSSVGVFSESTSEEEEEEDGWIFHKFRVKVEPCSELRTCWRGRFQFHSFLHLSLQRERERDERENRLG